MRNLMAAMALFLLFSVAAPAAPALAPSSYAEIHAQGVIKAWRPQAVSIAHQAIPALNWPPMTMSFLLPPPVSALPAGTPVDFSFRQVAGGYQLTAIHASQR
ncbi:copper-binding protein [Gibbsiella quercinecans]|uniref:copper-binding protein n=1 Tax=Gibbsiella quercinecans TaxID=929813 RepID=UPI003A4D9C7D